MTEKKLCNRFKVQKGMKSLATLRPMMILSKRRLLEEDGVLSFHDSTCSVANEDGSQQVPGLATWGSTTLITSFVIHFNSDKTGKPLPLNQSYLSPKFTFPEHFLS